MRKSARKRALKNKRNFYRQIIAAVLLFDSIPKISLHCTSTQIKRHKNQCRFVGITRRFLHNISLKYHIICGRPVGRITRLGRPCVCPSVRLSVRPIRARNSKTKNVEKLKLV